jgi:hypothetical protein
MSVSVPVATVAQVAVVQPALMAVVPETDVDVGDDSTASASTTLPSAADAVAVGGDDRPLPLPTIRDGAVQRTGVELPSPSLPRLGSAGLPSALPVDATMPAGGIWNGPDCQPHAGHGCRGGARAAAAERQPGHPGAH